MWSWGFRRQCRPYLGGLPAQNWQVSTVRPLLQNRWYGSNMVIKVLSRSIGSCALGQGYVRAYLLGGLCKRCQRESRLWEVIVFLKYSASLRGNGTKKKKERYVDNTHSVKL